MEGKSGESVALVGREGSHLNGLKETFVIGPNSLRRASSASNLAFFTGGKASESLELALSSKCFFILVG